MPVLNAVLVITASYIIGAIPFGLIIGKIFKGIDIRKEGSGNIGAANAFRTLGMVPGSLVLIFDILKGVAAVYIASTFMPENYAALFNVIAGLAAIIGHNNSIFLNFKGGKGIATSFGVFLALNWKISLLVLLIYILMLLITKYSSVGSLSASAAMPVCMYVFRQPVEYTVFALLAAIFAFYKHKANIKRLIKGEELKVFGKKKEEPNGRN
ncbi:MAG: glycerol-3-phosphate 1-O-acyltransferase PlsY [Armatimonadota bacterium]